MSEAHEAIRNLLGRYCELMDAGDFDGLAGLFADARLSDEHGNVFARGAAEVAAMWHKQTILYDGSPRTRHVTANPIIEVDEAVGEAAVRSSYIVFQGALFQTADAHGEADIPLQPIITGRYVDRFVRGDEGVWRWDERSYAIDHLGDLSHHLRR
jgi:3-phenylpropionate/cinnamic acid dioxygenase small subunit